MQKILGELDPEQEKVRCLSCSALALAPPPPPPQARAHAYTPRPRGGALGRTNLQSWHQQARGYSCAVQQKQHLTFHRRVFSNSNFGGEGTEWFWVKWTPEELF